MKSRTSSCERVGWRLRTCRPDDLTLFDLKPYDHAHPCRIVDLPNYVLVVMPRTK
jgi:hypothetical protein